MVVLLLWEGGQWRAGFFFVLFVGAKIFLIDEGLIVYGVVINGKVYCFNVLLNKELKDSMVMVVELEF